MDCAAAHIDLTIIIKYITCHNILKSLAAGQTAPALSVPPAAAKRKLCFKI
jgi:hypothetical protein